MRELSFDIARKPYQRRSDDPDIWDAPEAIANLDGETGELGADVTNPSRLLLLTAEGVDRKSRPRYTHRSPLFLDGKRAPVHQIRFPKKVCGRA